jgi:hypothetical protein
MAEPPIPHVRYWTKRPLNVTPQEPAAKEAPPLRARGAAASSTSFEAEAWWSQVHFSGASEESTAFWNDPDAAVQIAIDMPTSQ